jgi:circadian clock protein KaiC
MAKTRVRSVSKTSRLKKVPSGIVGVDAITSGGLPKGRPTLVSGSAGSGKTLLAMQFLIHGATVENEPGVFVAFEETAEDLISNVAGLGFDLRALEKKKRVALESIAIEPDEYYEAGEFDLSGLFIRLDYAVKSIGAKRIVLDTVEVLFAGFTNHGIIRAELFRLFAWIKARGLTAVVTAEKGDGTLSRHGVEEYVSDCVIFLDHRVIDQVSTRRLRVVKYRGTAHGTNEYPFIIDRNGLAVLPITSLKLDHDVSTERTSTGIAGVDAMFGGKGFYKGSSILVSGMPGTGKSSVAAHFAEATCRRGGSALYFGFEESESQRIRNMRSIGMDLARWTRKKRLRFVAVRPTFYGLETHLALMHREIDEMKPDAVIIDPINNLVSVGDFREVKLMLMRIVDRLKQLQITALLTSLTFQGTEDESHIGLSSLMDTWMQLRAAEHAGARHYEFFIVKSRGMAHSHAIRPYEITDEGLCVRPREPELP